MKFMRHIIVILARHVHGSSGLSSQLRKPSGAVILSCSVSKKNDLGMALGARCGHVHVDTEIETQAADH